MAGTRLDRWLAPRLALRARDTEREIADAPVDFAVRRGSTDLPALTGRIIDLAASGGAARGDGTISVRGDAAILFAAGTDLRRDDRLSAAGGVAYRVTFVQPGQVDRLVVAVEAVSR